MTLMTPMTPTNSTRSFSALTTRSSLQIHLLIPILTLLLLLSTAPIPSHHSIIAHNSLSPLHHTTPRHNPEPATSLALPSASPLRVCFQRPAHLASISRSWPAEASQRPDLPPTILSPVSCVHPSLSLHSNRWQHPAVI